MTLLVACDRDRVADPAAILMAESYRPEPLRVDDRPETCLRCRWLERVQADTPYPELAERLALVAEAVAPYGSPILVIRAGDRVVVDLLRQRTRIPVTFLAAKADVASPDVIRKRDMTAALDLLRQAGRLDLVPGLLEGDLDDRVTLASLRLAAWYATSPEQGASFVEVWRARAARAGAVP